MSPTALEDKLKATIRIKNLLTVLLVMSILTTFILGAAFSTKKTEVLIMPSTVDTYAIQSGRATDNYVKRMTLDISNLLISRHPYDTEFFKTNILQLSDPRFHPTIEKQIAYDEANNKFKMGTRVFRPSQVCMVRGERIESEVVGDVDVYVNDKRTTTNKVQRRFVWSLSGFHLRLMDTYEVTAKESVCLSAGA